MLNIKTYAPRGARLAVVCGLGMTLAFGGVAATAIPAYATPDQILTVNNLTNGQYKVYCLFTGDFTADGTVAGKYNFAPNATNVAAKSAVIGALEAMGQTVSLDGMSDMQVANTLTDKIVALGEKGLAGQFANTLASKLTGVTATKTGIASEGTLAVSGLEAGYYLVMADSEDTNLEGEPLTSAILMPVHTNAAEAEAKQGTPEVDKTVKDDGDGSFDNDFNGSADVGLVADQMSKLTFKITGSVPANLADFTSGENGKHNYIYKFVDTLPKGFNVTANELQSWNVQIKCGEIDLTDSFTASVTPSTDAGSQITWGTDDLKGVLIGKGVSEDQIKTGNLEIAVTYVPVYDEADIEAMVKYNAKLDAATNTAKIEFSNSPYSEGTGETGDEDAKVYSYSLELTKVGKDAAPLDGAEFKLTAGDEEAGKVVTSDETGVFKFAGLESDVVYTLTETKAPSGMKGIDPIQFKINATRDDASGDVTKINWEVVKDPSKAATFTEMTDGSALIELDVTNVPGSDLPVTGQAGIIGGVVVGGIVLAVSAVAAVRNRRNES